MDMFITSYTTQKPKSILFNELMKNIFLLSTIKKKLRSADVQGYTRCKIRLEDRRMSFPKVKRRRSQKKGYGKINLHSVQLQSILHFHHEAGNLIKFGKLA